MIKEGAEKISKLDYPNFWHQGNLKLRLSYQFEPGADADGVTVHIPLPLLNQVEESGFEWQIPGLRRELIIALIKSLPKPVRRNFVPAPNYAEAFLGRVTPLELPLLDSLERELRRMTGVTVDREDWHWDQVPDHLKITFRVVDDKNKKLKEGRSLQDLKDALKGKVQETLSAVADDGIEQSGLHIWSFGQLPESYEQKRGNYKVKAWPALVDERDSVAIKLFDNPLEQKQAMWNGLRRLLLLNIPSPIKYLHGVEFYSAKSYSSKGQDLVERNWQALALARESVEEVPLQPVNPHSANRPPVVSDAAPDFVKTVTAAMLAGLGDALPVSALPPDGTWPMGTTRWEKRNIAEEIPIWKEELCTQCNHCVAACPHSAIRAKVVPPEAMENAPASLHSLDVKSRDMRGQKYVLQVAPEDCTGCNLE